jgi:wyosine [tRNA(Phe)-imidazoG37] synthetase (radical SAM superfamily)
MSILSHGCSNDLEATMRHLFGPVPSRRLGLSLGVDLTPAKTCLLNCLYCEAGITTTHTAIRREYVPTADVLAELDEFLKSSPKLDHITFSGAGEPTLHSGLGEVVNHIRSRWPQYRTALLTNGTLFPDPQVRREAMAFDLVCPSLDAGTEAVYRRINRPVEGLTLTELVDGLIRFRNEYRGLYLLEVFLLEGVNDDPAEIRAIADFARAIAPDQVQLNTLDRPGAEPGLVPIPYERLEAIAAEFVPIPARAVNRRPAKMTASVSGRSLEETILDAVKRRPCTAEDLAAMTGAGLDSVRETLRELRNTGRITIESGERGEFYRVG